MNTPEAGKKGKLFVFTLLGGLAFGLAAQLAWLYEIIYLIGWDGTEWLNYSHRSVFVITMLAVLAYLLPFRLEKPMPLQKWLAATALLFGHAILAYYLAKPSVYELFGKASIDILPPSGWLLFLALSNAYAFFYATNLLIHSVSRWLILCVALAIIASLPVSAHLVDFWNGPAPFHHDELVDGVKAGLPFLWLPFSLSLCGYVANQFLRQPEEKPPPEEYEDILDAPFE